MSNLSQIEGIFSAIQGKSSNDLQTPEQVSQYLTDLTGWLAFVNEQMAANAMVYNVEKKAAYSTLQEQYRAAGVKMPPSLAKDYVESLCAKQLHAYDMAERCSRTITHVIDAMRSVLSSQKAEMNMMRFGGGGFVNG